MTLSGRVFLSDPWTLLPICPQQTISQSYGLTVRQFNLLLALKNALNYFIFFPKLMCEVRTLRHFPNGDIPIKLLIYRKATIFYINFFHSVHLQPLWSWLEMTKRETNTFWKDRIKDKRRQLNFKLTRRSSLSGNKYYQMLIIKTLHEYSG